MKKDLRTYPAYIVKDGDGYSVQFPDLPGCLTCAPDMPGALSAAKEALEGFIYYSEKDGDVLSAPTPIEELRAPEGGCVSLVGVRMDLVREQEENKTITKSVTIPSWLNKLALEAGINFSQELQTALRQKLCV